MSFLSYSLVLTNLLEIRRKCSPKLDTTFSIQFYNQLFCTLAALTSINLSYFMFKVTRKNSYESVSNTKKCSLKLTIVF